jgi:hypothetical protein
MNQDNAATLESEFGIHFPSAYRHAITYSYPFTDETEELNRDPTCLRSSNAEFRSTPPWGFPWRPEYWCIGDDGTGGFYFIDTSKDDSTVYYCDHEDMPDPIDDVEQLYATPFAEFIQKVLDSNEHMKQWEEEMKDRVARRRWWQFWIPRQWLPKRIG